MEDGSIDFQQLKLELWDVQGQYEETLMNAAKFPRGGQTNRRSRSSLPSNDRVLEFIDHAMENWKLLGSQPDEAKMLLQVLTHLTN
jgi:hypothetical protein